MFDEFNFLDITESQFVAMKNKLSYVTPTHEVRAKAPNPLLQSPYTNPTDTGDSSSKPIVIFQRKYPFDQHYDFVVEQDLIDSFEFWIKQKLSKKWGKEVYYISLLS